MYKVILIAIGLQTIFILSLFAFLVLYRIYLYWQEQNHNIKIESYYHRFQELYLSYYEDEISEERLLDEMGKFDKTIVEQLIFNFIENNKPKDAKNILPKIFICTGIVDKYIKLLKSKRWWEQGIAAQKLGRMGISSAIPELMNYSSTKNPEVNLAKTWAIAKIDGDKAINDLIKALNIPGEFSPVIIKKMLIAIGNQVLEPLLNILEDSKVDVQKNILEVLAYLDDPQIVPILIKYLNHPNLELQISAIKSLGKKGAQNANNRIIALMDHDQWEVRAMAAKSLGQIGCCTSINILDNGLKDVNWWVRLNSAESLLKIYPEGMQVLQRTTHGKDRFSADIAKQVLAKSHIKSI